MKATRTYSETAAAFDRAADYSRDPYDVVDADGARTTIHALDADHAATIYAKRCGPHARNTVTVEARDGCRWRAVISATSCIELEEIWTRRDAHRALPL